MKTKKFSTAFFILISLFTVYVTLLAYWVLFDGNFGRTEISNLQNTNFELYRRYFSAQAVQASAQVTHIRVYRCYHSRVHRGATVSIAYRLA